MEAIDLKNKYRYLALNKRTAPGVFKLTKDNCNLQVFEDYLKYISTQYDIQYDVIKSGDRAGEQIEIKKPKIPSVTTFCHFMGITKRTFYDYLEDKNNVIDEDTLHFISYVHEQLKEDRLSKGLNGTINAQLLARVDGYNDTVNVDQQITLVHSPVNVNNTVIDLTSDNYEVLT